MVRRTLLLIAILLTCCSKKSAPAVVVETPARASTDFNRLKSVLAGIRPGEVELYEGLPSNFWEPELRERELRQKETQRFHGHPVYAQTLEVAKSDCDQLTALLAAKESYKPYSTEKSCGEFQPDYVVVWKQGSEATQAIVSLECGEVQIFGSGSDLHCDLSPAAAERLKQMLSSHHKHRPAPTTTGS